MRITLNRLTKQFGKITALNDVTADIPERSITTLLGPNGAGKTTLMRILAGLIIPDSGEFFFDGFPPSNMPEQKRLVGYLPENNPLYGGLYVSELLEFQSRVYKVAQPLQRIKILAEQLNLTKVLHQKISQLSKGTRQRVGIAQVLIPNPHFLILDEPSNGLDPNQHEELRKLLMQLKQDKTILLSTHLLNEVQNIYDHTLILNQGKIVSDRALLDPGALNNSTSEICVEFDQALSPQMLKQFPLPILSVDHTKLVVRGEAADRPKIFTFAVSQGLILIEIQIKNQSLLQQYHQVTLK